MWKILGKDAIYIDIPDVVKNRLMELAGEGEKPDRFRGLMAKSEVTYLLNGETEESSFFIRVPDDISPEDIQIMADVILEVAKTIEFPFISASDVEQRYKIIVTNDKEPELLGLNKTPGMSSVEVFKPIFRSLDGPGKECLNQSRYNFD